LFKSNYPDTRTYTHPIDFSLWTIKVVDN